MEDLMKKIRLPIILLILSVMISFVFAGCNSKDQDFTFSRDLDNNGYWRGVKALKYVELCDYKGITVPKDRHTVSDDELQSAVESLLSEQVYSIEVTDRAVVYGDTLNIDYVGRIGGVAFEGGSTGGAGTEVTIGVTSYIDDFLEQLVGHSPGETFDIEVTFPDNYGKEELNGKDAVFTVTINHIVESVLPELTDAFINSTFSQTKGWTTVEQMKADMYREIQSAKIADYIQEYLKTNSTVKEIPKIITDYQDTAVIKYYQDYANYYQVTLEEFLQQYLNVENQQALLEQYKEDNINVSKMHLITQAIAEKEKIKATADDVTQYFVKHMNTDDYSQYEEVYGLNYLKMTVLVQMVINYVQASVVLE